MSGLCVNFHKSKLVGVNLELDFIEATSSFMSCEVGIFPFLFLGISIGENLGTKATWNPFFNKFQQKLSLWKSRKLSISGVVALLNSVVNSLSINFLSFFSAPKLVVKEIIRLQRTFLCGGEASTRKIKWLSWNKVCLSKEEGGLGVKHCELFKYAFLGKWFYRILREKEALWHGLLIYRYVNILA